MREKGIGVIYKLINTIAFILVIVVNVLAETLPINGVTNGQIAELYPNLFTPPGWTFSVWGVIYSLLALFILYQWGVFKGKSGYNKVILKRISPYFIISSLANVAWIYSWHYNMIALSVVMMIVIFFSLMLIYTILNEYRLTKKEKVFIKLPISFYYAWITIAAIANVTVLLVSLGFDGLGISEEVWMAMILAAGMIIGVVTTIKERDVAYGLVILWAYIGIFIKHVSPSGFDSAYAGIVIYLAIAIVVILISVLIAAVKSKKELKPKS